MANTIELCDKFAIEESPEGRFLIDNWSKSHKRLVDICDADLTYINLKTSTTYYNFKVRAKNNCIGLMQLKGCCTQYSDISDTKHCNDHVLNLSDVLVIPTEYEDISVQHIFERFGVQFPIARKNNGLYDVFANGNKLQNACGSKVLVKMRPTKANYVPQIISYLNGKISVISKSDEIIFSTTDKQFPDLCFIQNADNYASIRPSYQEFKTNIWGYNANEKLGIVYLDSNHQKQNYVIDEIPFFSKDTVYFINENFIIYDFHQIKFLYFRGTYVGTISYFDAATKEDFFVHTDKGFYIGKSFFNSKDFFDTMYLHQRSISKTSALREITLQSGISKYNFTFDSETGYAKKVNKF